MTSVPVHGDLFQNKPVLLPFCSQEALALLLLVEPALVVHLTQLLQRHLATAHHRITYGKPTYGTYRQKESGTATLATVQAGRQDDYVLRVYYSLLLATL